MKPNLNLAGTFTLPGTSIALNRMGYGAMQLPGPQVWGPPKDRQGAVELLSRLLKKILGEGSVPSPTSFLRAFSRNLYARIADFLAFGHTSPRAYAEGTTARFLIRTRL